MFNDYANSNHKFKAISLSYFNPLRVNIKNDLSEQPLGKSQNIMPIIVRTVKKNKKIQVLGKNYDSPDSNRIRDYIQVQDLADAPHLIAIKKLSKLKGQESINLGLRKGMSVQS